LLSESGIKNMMLHLKNRCDLDLTLTMPPKVKSMVSSYVALRIIQLLFETFFRIYHSFREILMYVLFKMKYCTLYEGKHHIITHYYIITFPFIIQFRKELQHKVV